MTTDKLLHKLIGDVREQQVVGQAAIKLCARKKYTETKVILICALALARIDKILRTAESEIR
jgi:hypothetical protein